MLGDIRGSAPIRDGIVATLENLLHLLAFVPGEEALCMYLKLSKVLEDEFGVKYPDLKR